MKDLEKNTRRFYICQFVPFTSIFDFPVATWTLRVIFNIGETMNHFEDKKGKHMLLEKKSRQSKIWGALFQKFPEKSCKHFCYISLASNSSGLNLYQHMFQNLHIYNLSTFSGIEDFLMYSSTNKW